MQRRDLFRFAARSILAQRWRTFLTALGIAVGVAAVVLLTSIGEGTYRFVLGEFTQFGTHLLSVQPGKVRTHGVPGAVFGSTRPLTIDDANALVASPHVTGVNPVVHGNAQIEGGGHTRRTTVLGVGPELLRVWRVSVAAGVFLPADAGSYSARPLAVLGAKLRRELFGDRSPLGEKVRVGGNRYTVVGVLESKGQFLGFDLDDAIHLPAARALELYNREGLFEINVLYTEEAPVDDVVAGIRRILIARHGREDFTIITQKEMLDVLGSVLNILTFSVSALGGISLLVGGVGILTMQTIAVTERVSEVGLLKALGAERGTILALFLIEAAAVGAVGGLTGLAVGAGGAQLLRLVVPALPVHTPIEFAILAEIVAVSVGLVAGVLPAQRASRLDPVASLRGE